MSELPPLADVDRPRRPGEGEPRAALGRGLGSLLAVDVGAGTFGGLDRHDAWVRDHGSKLRPVVRVAVEVEPADVVQYDGPAVMAVELVRAWNEMGVPEESEADASEPEAPAPPSIADPVADDEPEEAGMVSVAEIVAGPVGRPTLAESLAALRAMGVDG